MNIFALQHIVDSAYCFPISENVIVLRFRTAKNDIQSIKVIYGNKYVFSEEQKIKDMKKKYTDEFFDFYEVRLELDDTRLAYVFYLSDEKDSYYFSEDGISSEYNFTKAFYNFFQYPYINKADIFECVPWMKKAVFYQIFVDRFHMGDLEIDKSYINCKWGDKPTPKTFAGGDIKGIIQKLDYLKNLGINTIYLTPIFKSISNHKYDISDYYTIDSHFGNNQDLKELVTQIHKRKMRIVLDAVFNHCSEKLMQFQDVLKLGKKSAYFDWFIIKGDTVNQKEVNYETFAACSYMPKLNTSNEEVQEFLLDISSHYIKEYDIDGWRLDVSDEISHDFWRTFRKRVKSLKSDAVIIGENWHNASNYLHGDQYDSIMNYAFTKACLDFLATKSKTSEQMAWKLNELLVRNNEQANQMMLNLLDSHDTHRFFKEIDGDRFKMKVALSLLFFYKGTPCIFYGTEILTWGGYDPDCRKCMDWNKANPEGEFKDIYDLIRFLSKLRQENTFQEGEFHIFSNNDVLFLSYENSNNSKDKLELSIDIKKREIKIENNGEVIYYE